MNTKIDPIDKCIIICVINKNEIIVNKASNKDEVFELGYPDSLELFDIDITVDD